MLKRLSELIERELNNFSARWWMKYYKEKYKNAILYKKRKKLNDKGVQ